MKEHEKQAIDEMAAVIASAIEFDDLDFGMDEKTEIIAEKAAKAFYNAGYRKQEWISVEERLPQKHDEVLVFCDGARQLDFICSDGRWYDHDHKKVTHWMPIPEAPKGGEE